MSKAVKMKITRSAIFVGDARWDVLIFASGVWACALGSARANCVTNREPSGRSRGFGARLAGALWLLQLPVEALQDGGNMLLG